MGKKLSTYWSDEEPGKYCEIHINLKEEYFYIKYFDANGKMYYKEDHIGKSMRWAEDAAENWALGIKKIGVLYG